MRCEGGKEKINEKGVDMKKPKNPILRLPAVSRLTGLSKSTIHRRYRNGTFPLPRKLGPNSIGWPSKEIRHWMKSLPPPTNSVDER